jgi:hypothetical protein
MASDVKHKNSYGTIKAIEYNGVLKYSQIYYYKDTSKATMLINHTTYSMHRQYILENYNKSWQKKYIN